MTFSQGFLGGVGLLGKTRGYAMLVALGVLLAVAAVGSLHEPGGAADNARIEAAEAFEQVLVDACTTAIRFDHPRAKIGFTSAARSMPDHGFLVVVPFKVGKVQRQARCIGRDGGLAEFSVERVSRVL